jgi:hypothetical protein
MKTLALISILLLTSITVFSQKAEEKEIKTFIFGTAEISGTKSKPSQSNINVIKDSDFKTKINPRTDFLPELSLSIDEI